MFWQIRYWWCWSICIDTWWWSIVFSCSPPHFQMCVDFNKAENNSTTFIVIYERHRPVPLERIQCYNKQINATSVSPIDRSMFDNSMFDNSIEPSRTKRICLSNVVSSLNFDSFDFQWTTQTGNQISFNVFLSSMSRRLFSTSNDITSPLGQLITRNQISIVLSNELCFLD